MCSRQRRVLQYRFLCPPCVLCFAMFSLSLRGCVASSLRLTPSQARTTRVRARRLLLGFLFPHDFAWRAFVVFLGRARSVAVCFDPESRRRKWEAFTFCSGCLAATLARPKPAACGPSTSCRRPPSTSPSLVSRGEFDQLSYVCMYVPLLPHVLLRCLP